MNEFKMKRMLAFNHHCGNCKWQDKEQCIIPIKQLSTFEGTITKPLKRNCVYVIATSRCHWKRAKND